MHVADAPLRLLAERLEIREVFCAAGRALVQDERSAAEHGHPNPGDLAVDAVRPRAVEIDAADRRENVDPIGRNPELRDDLRTAEVTDDDSEVLDRRAECSQSPKSSIIYRQGHLDRTGD